MKCQVFLIIAFLAVTAFSDPHMLESHTATNGTNGSGLVNGASCFSRSWEVFIFGSLALVFSMSMGDTN
jgi:hypothetical protein